MNGAVLHSDCTQNVCCLSWLNSYLESLPNDDKSKVMQNESHTVFKFGDGKLFNSLKSVTIPAKIGHNRTILVKDVIDKELISLLNKKEMKMAKVKIDFDNDIIKSLDNTLIFHSPQEIIILYQLVEQTKQLLKLLRSTVEDLSSLVLLVTC